MNILISKTTMYKIMILMMIMCRKRVLLRRITMEDKVTLAIFRKVQKISQSFSLTKALSFRISKALTLQIKILFLRIKYRIQLQKMILMRKMEIKLMKMLFLTIFKIKTAQAKLKQHRKTLRTILIRIKFLVELGFKIQIFQLKKLIKKLSCLIRSRLLTRLRRTLRLRMMQLMKTKILKKITMKILNHEVCYKFNK